MRQAAKILVLFLMSFPAHASERLEILRMRLSISNDYASAASLFADTSSSAIRLRNEKLPKMGALQFENSEILNIAGGSQFHLVMDQIDVKLANTFGGSPFGSLDGDVVACRTPDKNYDCLPYSTELLAIAAMVRSACAKDYHNWGSN